MEENANTIEQLLERVVEYGKTSLDLLRMKALNKISNAVSSFISKGLVLLTITTFLFFLNLGLALWLGELFNKVFFGFFAVAGFYGILGIVFRVFFYEITKKKIKNYIIKISLK